MLERAHAIATELGYAELKWGSLVGLANLSCRRGDQKRAASLLREAEQARDAHHHCPSRSRQHLHIDSPDVRLRASNGRLRKPGDTHFAFVVPERAFEDTEVVKCRPPLPNGFAATLLQNPLYQLCCGLDQ